VADLRTSLDEHFPGSLPGTAYLDTVADLLKIALGPNATKA